MQKAREKHLALLINSNFPLNVYACVFLMGKKKQTKNQLLSDAQSPVQKTDYSILVGCKQSHFRHGMLKVNWKVFEFIVVRSEQTSHLDSVTQLKSRLTHILREFKSLVTFSSP